MKKDKIRILFFGTPEFAVGTLQKLVENEYNVVGVVTAPDKPAGRGLNLKMSDIKVYAEKLNVPILQPFSLKDQEFLNELQKLNADLFIVVAFRMLPEQVWKMPPKGTINLHASLLPNYRGAAPINWAIINGESITGVTTFFINEAIDTGNIIKQREVKIDDMDTASQLHDKLMEVGALLVLETVDSIINKTIITIDQKSMVENNNSIKKAPKLFKEDRKIDWNQNVKEIYNKIRGLSVYPSAYFILKLNGILKEIKVFNASFEINSSAQLRNLLTDGKTFLKIGCNGGYLILNDLQMEGKKRMIVQDFLRGFNVNQNIEIEA